MPHKRLTGLQGLICLALLSLASSRFHRCSGDEPAQTLTANWLAKSKLPDAGVTPFATMTSEAWVNYQGGVKAGWWWNYLLDFGLNIDGEKAWAVPGSGVFADFHWARNRRDDGSFADYTGATAPISGIIASDHFRVYNLYYRQGWNKDRVFMKIGQLAADDDFMLSDYTGLFANSTLGALPSQVDVPSFPVYPVASPGLFARVNPAEQLYLQVGLYYGRPGEDVRSNFGFDWANQSDPALAMFYEAGWRYKIREHPAAFKLGGTYFSGAVADYRAINDGHLTATDRGTYSFYAVHDVALVTTSNGDPKLGWFVRGGVKPQLNKSIVAAYADTGLNWFGPISCRPNDVVGIAAACTFFGQEYRKWTGMDGVARAETTLAMAYKAQLTPWLALQADAQLLFNPAKRSHSEARQTAHVLGLRAQMKF